MSTEELMRRIALVFATGDIAEVDKIVSPEYLDYQGLGGVPLHGPAGFRQVVATARRVFDRLDVTIEDLIVGVDRAAARIRWRGVSAEGVVAERETIDIVRFARKKAVEHWGAKSWERTSQGGAAD